MRHGRVDTGSGRCFLGRTDLSLDETGQAQARAWQPVLRDAGITRVVTSGLSRARETAALCCPDHPAGVDARLNEINLGEWEGCSFEEIRTRFPGAFTRRGQDLFHYRPPGGESFEDLFLRAAPFFTDLEKRMPGLGGHTLVIAHAGVIRTMCCFWAKKSMDRLFDFRPARGDLLVLCSGPVTSGSPPGRWPEE